MAGGLRGGERRIWWEEAMAIANGGEIIHVWRAIGPPGELADTPLFGAPSGGFWVPSIWLCPEYGGKRLSELSEEQRRNRSDHWEQLGAKLRGFLEGSDSPASETG
jgi:hypothetical protein